MIFRITGTLKSREQKDSNDAGAALEVSSDGQMHRFPASQVRSPSILLSSYDLVVMKNAELQEVNEHLAAVNGDLQRTVDILQQANATLRRENARLKRI